MPRKTVASAYRQGVVSQEVLSRDEALSVTYWEASLRHACRLQIPDARLQFLYEAARRWQESAWLSQTP